MNKKPQKLHKSFRWGTGLSVIALLLALLLTACAEFDSSAFTENVNESSQIISNGESAEEKKDTEDRDEPDGDTETQAEEIQTAAEEAAAEAGDTAYVFSLADIPEYSGEAFTTVNSNTPTFTAEELSEGVYESYSKRDSLGRCGVAMAMLGTELLPTEERGEIGSVKPTGWHTVKYSSLIDGNYLYNRCHLLAYELTGENANENNLITGTRYMNVQGMLPFENFITAYVKATGNHVLYRVTPIFDGDDLVARGVWMEAESVGAAGVCFSVFCYNIQPGVGIDYATGDSWEDDTYSAYVGNTTGSVDSVATGGSYYAGQYTVAGDGLSSENDSASGDLTEENNDTSGGHFVDSTSSYDYIANANTKKFHRPGCSSVDRMSDSNKLYFAGTAEELEAQGYSPCKNCL